MKSIVLMKLWWQILLYMLLKNEIIDYIYVDVSGSTRYLPHFDDVVYHIIKKLAEMFYWEAGGAGIQVELFDDFGAEVIFIPTKSQLPSNKDLTQLGVGGGGTPFDKSFLVGALLFTDTPPDYFCTNPFPRKTIKLKKHDIYAIIY